MDVREGGRGREDTDFLSDGGQLLFQREFTDDSSRLKQRN